MLYISTRCEDIEQLKGPILVNGVEYKMKFRIFSGDNPARQFEAGQQRGGHYTCICGIQSKNHMNLQACFRQRMMSLEERRETVVRGEIWKELQKGILNPFQNMKKQDLEDELENRNIDTSNLNRNAMQQQLQETMSGIVRTPALSMQHPEDNLGKQNLQNYEVLCCEPLHDISGMVKNLIEELPSHLENKTVRTDYEKFSADTIGDRNQVKGSDARLFAIKLVKFTINKKNEGKVSDELVRLISSLVEIINIAYSGYENRSPRQLLRLYNQCFIFAVLCKKIIGNPVKMTSRKFYGIHFHSITTHLAETFRIINTKSVLTEQEERSFGNLRRISSATSNRKAGWVVDNAVIRFKAQQNSSDNVNSFIRQDSSIKQQARLLPKQPGTTIPSQLLHENPSLVQSHMERIADFLEPGENIWWHYDGRDVIFHDSYAHPNEQIQGPILSHFRNSSIPSAMKRVDEAWNRCITMFTENKLKLPLLKIKSYENGKPKWTIPRPIIQENGKHTCVFFYIKFHRLEMKIYIYICVLENTFFIPDI